LDSDRRRALSEFYREEFLRHFDFLETAGLVSDSSREALERARQRFLSDLERVCWRADFPLMAETLLQNFNVLTRLSELDPTQGH